MSVPVDDASAVPAAGAWTAELFHRLARPFHPSLTLPALTGLAPIDIERRTGESVALSLEARRLLGAMPGIVRALATSMKTHHERCIGQLRGPVLWSETMSARASSFGDPDLFVCATPSRAYDVDENQVLVAALADVAAAGRAALTVRDGRVLDERAREAGRVGLEAERWMAHPSLSPVSRVRPTARALRRTRAGKHHRTYRPALEVLARAADPLTAAEVAAWVDPRTAAQHRVVMGLIARIEQGGVRRVPPLRAERGSLHGGPLQYRAAPHGVAGPGTGVLLGPLLVDVPARAGEREREVAELELRARAGRRESLLVLTEADLDRAVARAVELTSAS